MYRNELEQCLVRALDKARTTKMQPRQTSNFQITEEYTLRVYCYAGFVRRYSVRDEYGCVASSTTEEGIIYSFIDY